MKSSFAKKHQTFLGSCIFVLASLFLSYEMILQVSPSIMTQQLMSEFNINAAILGVIASLYFYSYTAMQIPSGLLYDRFGPRLLITIACGLCAAGSLFFGITHSVFLLGLGRFLLGIGSAFAYVGALTVAARWFPPSTFALFVGILQFIGCIGATCGAYPLAQVIDLIGWRSTMNYLGILGICLTVLCGLFIRNRPPQDADAPADLHHHLSFAKSVKAVVSQNQTWALAVYSFCNWAPALIFPALWGVPYLMGKYSISNATAAFACSMVWVGVAIFSPLIGWLSDRLQRRNILLTSTTAIGFILSLVLLFGSNLPYTLICIILFILGGASSGNLICFAVAKDINRPSVTSTAMGFNNMAVVLSGAVFQPVVGWILDKLWDGAMLSGAPFYSTKNYTLALLSVPACYLISWIVAGFFIKETFCKHTYDPLQDQLK
jgi:MFS family permease